LLDINTAVGSIEDYLGSERSFTAYKSNKMLRRAVEREFEIIGEALNKLMKIDPDIKISSTELIIGMRNRVIHGYDKIDDEIVWGAIVRHIPILKAEIQALLKST
tara:strand:+ start:380 stop:694 length:315 start_codon:yes stop_codon:yes gene_type:complete